MLCLLIVIAQTLFSALAHIPPRKPARIKDFVRYRTRLCVSDQNPRRFAARIPSFAQ